MSSNKTKNYQLNQWEPDDQVVRTDFNRDNLNIDAAIKAASDAAQSAKNAVGSAYSPANSPIAVGSYVGDGTAKRKISLPFTPRAVLVLPIDGRVGSGSVYMGGLAVTGSNASLEPNQGVTDWNEHYTILSVTQNGFYVAYNNAQYYSQFPRSNEDQEHYNYIALR